MEIISIIADVDPSAVEIRESASLEPEEPIACRPVRVHVCTDEVAVEPPFARVSEAVALEVPGGVVDLDLCIWKLLHVVPSRAPMVVPIAMPPIPFVTALLVMNMRAPTAPASSNRIIWKSRLAGRSTQRRVGAANPRGASSNEERK
jgi:hypothetical protein